MTLGQSTPPSTRVWLGAILVFVASCAVLISAFAYDFFPLQADETSLGWQARLARDGYVPYRDYFAYKPPVALYLPAGVFSILGTSLAVLRVFSVVALAGTAVLLYLLCVRARMGAWWAACAALVLPALLVPYWPVPSGQWMSLAFGFAALLCVAGASVSWGAAFAAGLLVGLAGLCVQTHGVLFAGLLGLRLLADPEARSRRVLLAATAGIGLPLIVVVVLLWFSRALDDAFRDVVLWPLRYYKQAGGFNDVAAEAGSTAVEWDVPHAFEVARLLFVLATPWIATLVSLLEWYRGRRGWRATFALLGYVILWLLFFRGRTDPVHLVFLAPVFLYLVVQHVDWRGGGTGVRLIRVWLAIALVFMLRWPVHWLEVPPSLSAVREVDARWTAEGVPSLVNELPGVGTARLPVLFLGAHGASLYFVWSPVVPPVDWLQPADRLNSPHEYQLIADFAQRHEVPYIVLQLESAELWTRDPSPVRDVLREQYQRAFETSWGTAFCRVGAVVPSSGEVLCGLPRPSP